MRWYIVIKTIKGYRYRYRQRTWREGKHVRTASHYLGPADAGAGKAGRKKTRQSRTTAHATRKVNTTVVRARAKKKVVRAPLYAGQFKIPVGKRVRFKRPARSRGVQVDKILERRQAILAKHAAGKLGRAQFARQMRINEGQYLRALKKAEAG